MIWPEKSNMKKNAPPKRDVELVRDAMNAVIASDFNSDCVRLQAIRVTHQLSRAGFVALS